MAATKRAKMARAIVMAMRVPVNKEGKGTRAMASAMRLTCDKEGDGDGGKSNGNKVGGQAMATWAIATEGEQQSTSNGIDKGWWWLARER